MGIELVLTSEKKKKHGNVMGRKSMQTHSHMICSENCVLYAKAAIQWFCSTSHRASFPISSSGTSFFHVFAGSVSPLQTLYCNRCQNASVLKRHWRLYTVVAHCQDVPDAKGNLLNGNGSMPVNHRNDPLASWTTRTAPRYLTHSTALIKAQEEQETVLFRSAEFHTENAY